MYLSDGRPAKTSCVVEGGRALALVNISPALTEELYHLLRAKSRRPVEQGLAHIIHEVHLNP